MSGQRNFDVTDTPFDHWFSSWNTARITSGRFSAYSRIISAVPSVEASSWMSTSKGKSVFCIRNPSIAARMYGAALYVMQATESFGSAELFMLVIISQIYGVQQDAIAET